MTPAAIRWMLVGFVALTTAMAAGCSRWIDLREPAQDHRAPAVHAIADQDRVPLVMEGFRVTRNGAPSDPSSDFERRVLREVQDTRLFAALVSGGSGPGALGDKIITGRMTFHETIDPHAADAAWKGFVIGASMFLLSPVIELEYDYAARATLELERWDGQVKRYDAGSAGTARYNLFGAHPLVIDELKGHVMDACLTDLVDQIVRDTPFYMASGAPLPDGAARTITVKARRPASAVMPVSTAVIPE
jgi:hypothetical protein